MQLSNLKGWLSTFPGAESYRKFQPMILVARGPSSHSCSEELINTVDSSMYVTSAHCLDSSFSVLQKLEVVQGSTKCSYCRD